MQASTTMMWDTTISKILTTTAEQVESPLPIDAGEDKQKMENDSEQSKQPPKAEVRLVVRFTVEEQIVYKGKIQNVKTLDSQELSRIVSRVAWSDEPVEEAITPPSPPLPIEDAGEQTTTTSTTTITTTTVNAIKPPAEQRSLCTQTDTTSAPEKITPTQPALDPLDLINQNPKPVAQERAASNTQSSDHLSYVKPNPTSPQASPGAQKLDSIAQVEEPQKTEEPNTTNDCDIASEERLPNHVYEAGQQSLISSPPIHQNESQHQSPSQKVEDQVSGGNIKFEETSDLSPTSMADDASIESQSIADTLNDCVNTVDLEIRRYELKQTDVPIMHINPSGKRMRRAVPKDQRNLNTRTSANKTAENNLSPKQQITVPSRNGSTISLLANNKQAHPKIFARWSDNHFYPGTIVRLKDRKYVINFFDGAQRNVVETDLIPLANIEGKQVRVSIAKNYCVNAIVHDQSSPVDDQPMFDVEYQQDGTVRKCVPFKDIFLTGEQGTPLIMQTDKNSGASNFADVDLDNIIYEKRSRRLQELEDYELTENSSVNNKRKKGQYANMLGQEIYFTRSSPHRTKTSLLL